VTVDDVVSIAIAELGRDATPDRALLAEVLSVPVEQRDGRDVYPGVVPKAAALMLAMLRRRPYEWANARVALLTTTVFLNRNGLDLQAADDDLVALVAVAATGELSVLQVAAGLERLTVRLSDQA
jgi:prophage maintenance system killer protein